MAYEYYPTLPEFIRGIVKYHGSVTIDDLVKLVKIHKGQDITPEMAIKLGGLVVEGNVVRVPRT